MLRRHVWLDPVPAALQCCLFVWQDTTPFLIEHMQGQLTRGVALSCHRCQCVEPLARISMVQLSKLWGDRMLMGGLLVLRVAVGPF